MRRMIVALAALALVVGLAGCGADSPKDVYQKMWDAAEAGKREKCLSCFSSATRQTIGELEQLAQDLAGDQAQAARPIDRIMAEAKTTVLEIGEQKISGDRATLVVTINGKARPTRFIREDGAWKIDLSEELAKAKQALGFLKQLKGFKDAIDKRKKK